MRERSIRVLQEVLREQEVSAKIVGDCMRPAIEKDSDELVEPARVYWPGDICVFRRVHAGQNELVAHRALMMVYRPMWGRAQKAGWQVVTKADNALKADAPVALADCLGRIQTQIPLGVRLRSLADFSQVAASRVFAKLFVGQK